MTARETRGSAQAPRARLSHMPKTMPHSLNTWEGCVREYLEKKGGSALRSKLGSTVKLPPAVKLKYTAALLKCGFQVTGDTVLCGGDGCRGVTLSDLMGKRPSAQRPREDDDDEDERPARRKQRCFDDEPLSWLSSSSKQRFDEPLGWSIDPRPAPVRPKRSPRADEVPASADEEAARYERGFRFGAPSSGAGPRDGAPSRPPAAFRWARYECSWQALAPRSAGQQHYVNLLRDESVSVVLGLGKAGTGKTLLAVHEALGPPSPWP